MDATARQRTPLTILFCGLLLLTFAEHRLAELDFDSSGVARIENNEKPDGDEIFNRLIFVDDTAEAKAPAAGDACHAALISLESCSLAFATVLLSEPRAPPHSLSSWPRSAPH
jgi:hypothetical protein